MRSITLSSPSILSGSLRVIGLAITSIAHAQTEIPLTPREAAFSPDVWRAEQRIVDVHQHIEATPERLARAVGILDRCGVGTGIILGAGTVTANEGEISGFQQARELPAGSCIT